MTWIAQWLTQAWTQDLIRALTHSLWQGVLVAALLYGLLNGLQKVQPQTRYLAGLGALGALLLCVFATFAIFRLDRPEPACMNTLETTQDTESADPIPLLPDELHTPHVHIQTSRSVGWKTWAFGVWAVGVCLMLLRMLGLLLTYRSWAKAPKGRQVRARA